MHLQQITIQPNNKRIAVPVSEGRKLTIDLIANKIGVSTAALMRMAVVEYLDNHFPGWNLEEKERTS